MPNWVFGVIVVAVLLGVALLKEGGRMRELEGFASRRGMALHRPFAPDERPHIQRLAKQLDGRQGSSKPRWGAGLTGIVDGIEITIAEYEMPNRNSNDNGEWFVIVSWRVSGATPEAGFRESSQVIREGDWAAWRVEGNVTSSKVDELLVKWSDVRRQF